MIGWKPQMVQIAYKMKAWKFPVHLQCIVIYLYLSWFSLIYHLPSSCIIIYLRVYLSMYFPTYLHLWSLYLYLSLSLSFHLSIYLSVVLYCDRSLSVIIEHCLAPCIIMYHSLSMCLSFYLTHYLSLSLIYSVPCQRQCRAQPPSSFCYCLAFAFAQ